MVTTSTTFLPLADTTRGCANNWPSTTAEQILPKLARLTLAWFRTVSVEFSPSREMSLREVRTFVCAPSPAVMNTRKANQEKPEEASVRLIFPPRTKQGTDGTSGL